jgi:4'-phosphopantetheinyl transferase
MASRDCDPDWPRPGAGEVHLWSCELSVPDDAEPGYLALLDPVEIARWQRQRFQAGKRQLLCSHAMMRTVLGGCLGCAPAQLRFGRSERGKPFLEPPGGLSFNLAHAGDHALLAVTAGDAELGVDLERHRPGRRFDALARRHFAPGEVARLASLAAPARLGGFYDCWTLKEAYVKARGLGLALPLDGFWFMPGQGQGFGARADVDPQPAGWRFWSYREPEGYSAAVALRAGPVTAVPRHFRIVPLGHWQERPWSPRATLAGG